MMPPLPGDVQWFPAEIRRLIAAIKKHECIYNPRNESFGLREQQTKAWRSVAEMVGNGKTDTMCRDKWNCLRGTYRRHVRTEVTNNVKRRSGWPWAETMSFLRHYVMEKEDLLDIIPASKRSKTPPDNQQVNSHHIPIRPANTIKTVNISSANSVNMSGPPALAITGGIYSGGIIFNTKGLFNTKQGTVGILQPGQIPMLQTAQGLVRPAQPSVGMAIVQPTQSSVTMGKVQPSQTSAILSVASQNKTSNQTNTSSSEHIQVDLNKVKREPDSLVDKPEFVDISVKKEPMEEDELQLPDDFHFLPEDDSQESSQASQNSERATSVNKRLSPEFPNVRSSPKSYPTESEGGSDSNQLFMQSIVAHMKQMTPYDQSMFKMKVQQLLHDMMFPKITQKSV